MKRQLIINKWFAMILMIGLGVFTACQPEDSFQNNGLSSPIDASFTITSINGSPNRFLLRANSSDIIQSKWNLGIGEGDYAGDRQEEIFLPDAGTYNISHIAIGKGGESETVTQELVIAESDPIAGNLVSGGKFQDATDHAQWTIMELSPDADWVFGEGNATIHSNGGWAQEGIYQAIEVNAGQEYEIDMYVSSTGSFNEMWFEVYAGTTPPVIGQDYNDNKIMGLSTWDGCGSEPFSGKLSEVGCVANSATGSVVNTVTFANSGTIYLVIRCGANTFHPDGITITNVELRGTGN